MTDETILVDNHKIKCYFTMLDKRVCSVALPDEWVVEERSDLYPYLVNGCTNLMKFAVWPILVFF